MDADRTLQPFRLGRLARVPVLAALGLLALLALPSAAPAQQQGLVTGLMDQTHYQWSGDSVRAAWMDRTPATGAGMVRLFVDWGTIAGSQRPTDPKQPGSASYGFASTDGPVREARARGLTVLLTVNNAPAWAEGPGRPANANPGTWKPNPSDLADFVQAVAARYSGNFDPDGAGPSPPLPAAQALQVWNEPNQEAFLSPAYEGATPVSPDHYRSMLNASYQAVKAGNSQMLVVGGGTSPYGDPPGGPYPDPNNHRIRPVQFWQQVFSGPTQFDVFAHHPIDNTGGGPLQSGPDLGDASTPDLGRVVEVLRAAENAGTALPAGSHPVWVTEFWWDSNPPNSVGAPLDVQAAWIEQSLYLFWKAGASAAINFQLGDTTTLPNNIHAGFQSGVYFENGSPKPSLTAFRFPFVTERIDNQTLRAWGKAPEGGTLLIQQQKRGGWSTIKKLQVNKGAVFVSDLRSSGKAAMRATVGTSQSLVWQGSYGTTVLDTPGLVSYWRLGELSGTKANEVAGTNDGSYANTPTLGITGALIGDPDTAVSLNAGQNEYVSVGDNPMLDVGDMFSVELWFKRTGSATQTLIDKGPTGIAIWLQSDRIYFKREGDSSYIAVSNRTYADTNWHHLVVKKNGTAAKIFVDGVNVTTQGTNATVQNTANPFNIGSDSPTPGRFFSGSVDEVALYNTALSLTATTIANHYRAAGY